MAYRIEYDGRAGKYEVVPNRGSFPGIWMAVAAVFLLGLCFLQEGRQQFCAWLIPGDDMVTVQAFSAMTDDLRSGASLWTALEDFCHIVIYGQ